MYDLNNIVEQSQPLLISNHSNLELIIIGQVLVGIFRGLLNILHII